MLSQRKKIILLGILLSFLGAIGMKTMARKEINVSELPIRKVEIVLEKNQRDQFFDQLKEFAEKHGFAIRVAQTTPTGESFSIQLWREDFKILGANPFDAAVFRIGIYENDDSAKEVPLSYLDNLVSDLESFVLKTPGARFSEKKVR